MSTLGDTAHPNASTRLILISHASTTATRRAAFPGDEPLDRPGAMQSVNLGRIASVRAGPELRCRQTAAALGWDCTVDPALADLDFGAWRGQTLGEVADTSWLTDLSAAPHGGESVQDLLARVGAWLDGLRGLGERMAAVTHPAVIRAAIVHVLSAPAQSFWRIDVVPLSYTQLSHRGSHWTLRETGHPVNQ